MTARPKRKRVRDPRPLFADVEIPSGVLVEAQQAPGMRGLHVVEDYLCGVHGATPDRRNDGEEWRAYYRATRGRALDLLEDGVLSDNPREAVA